MAYCTIKDIYNYVDQVNATAMTDDFAQGNLNQPIIDSICALASSKVDALVSSIYSVPFQSPIPSKIYNAAVVFAVEMLYARRLTPSEKNPMKNEADMLRKELMDINRGLLSLDYQATRAFTPVIIRGKYNRCDANIY